MDKIEQALNMAINDYSFRFGSGGMSTIVIKEAQTQLQTLKQHLKDSLKRGKCIGCDNEIYVWDREKQEFIEKCHKPNCWLGEIVKEVGK